MGDLKITHMKSRPEGNFQVAVHRRKKRQNENLCDVIVNTVTLNVVIIKYKLLILIWFNRGKE